RPEGAGHGDQGARHARRRRRGRQGASEEDGRGEERGQPAQGPGHHGTGPGEDRRPHHAHRHRGAWRLGEGDPRRELRLGAPVPARVDAPSAEGPGLAQIARACGLYLALTLALTWPLAARLRLMDAGDSAFFAWEIGWELHALGTDPASLPHAPIFHPLPYTLGMDEPVLGTTLLVAPLRLFTDDAVLLYGIARLLTFVVTGLTTYLLARALRCTEGPALLAGA